MAKIRRNGPCPCGSGSKAKRCCQTPHAYVDVRVLPLDLCQSVLNDLPGTTQVEMRTLFDQLIFLPEIDTSVQVSLPGIITPDMEQAINALREDDDAGFDEALGKVVPAVDTLERRIELAQAVIELRNNGRIPPNLAAIAVLELDRPESTFFLSSVAESIAVLAGEQQTPAGLVVSAR
ncbi:MAG: SEC-C domain-containing protein [Acidimicrobiales bacterium]|nr:SEC-C domain-containing protein [Acidimicrobiales bacterium]